MHTHEIPTHLQVEDRLLAGLTVRQLFPMAVAAALCYWMWRHAGLAMLPRSLLCAATVALGVACVRSGQAERPCGSGWGASPRMCSPLAPPCGCATQSQAPHSPHPCTSRTVGIACPGHVLA
jgi:hypothetical protein